MLWFSLSQNEITGQKSFIPQKYLEIGIELVLCLCFLYLLIPIKLPYFWFLEDFYTFIIWLIKDYNLMLFHNKYLMCK